MSVPVFDSGSELYVRGMPHILGKGGSSRSPFSARHLTAIRSEVAIFTGIAPRRILQNLTHFQTDKSRAAAPGWPWICILLILSLDLLACTSNIGMNMTPEHQGEENSAQIRLETDPVWMIPDSGGKTRVNMALAMTNTGNFPIRFQIMDSVNIALEDEQGRRLLWEGGQDGIIRGPQISDPIPAGETFVLDLRCHLVSIPGQPLQLSIQDGLGSVWWIGPLERGAYRVLAGYENQSATSPDVWQGRAIIDPVSIHIN